MDPGPSPAGLPPVGEDPPDSQLHLLLTTVSCALEGGEGRAVCEPHHYTGLNLGKRAGGHLH